MDQRAIEQNVKHDAEAERVQETFHDFLHNFEVDDTKVYLAQVKDLEVPERNTLTVDFNHVEEYSSHLAQWLLHEFYRVYPYLCRALQLVSIDRGVRDAHKKELYVSVEQLPTRHRVRELTSDRIGTLLKISGQVVRTHPVHPELCRATFVCDECGSIVRGVEQQFKYTQPTKCSNGQCNNRSRFALDVHRSVFVDFQKVRIQEVQAELPRGAIPRAVEIIVRGEAVEAAQPGDRCDFTGTLIAVPDVAQLATAGGAKAESAARHRGRPQYDGDGLKGLKQLGVRELNYKLAFLACNVSTTNPKLGNMNYTHEPVKHTDLWEALSEAEREQLRRMADDKHIEKKLIDSLFPAIYGHDDVKRGALLMLFGGVPKRTPEGTTLRGDINVCLVGDPSTAKSQVLKTMEEFCPRAVYTSGKASTAAGLTAAVVKDEESFEFVIEAGALMLADNGVCCIDEFDKMDPKDQVAIHEAMEQQTISITKAGVKATLNARASILAAANPIGGRYDKSRSLRANIQMSAPIMSRFDLFFVLVDECNEVVDYAIARRIVDVHQHKAEVQRAAFSADQIQRYIMFARCFNPVIGDAAAERLVSEYKRLRLRDSGGGSSFSSWRITVRQLESLVRLSEALARLHCSDEVTVEFVGRASRLLHKSIVRVEQPDVGLESEDKENRDVMDDGGDGAAGAGAEQRAGALQESQGQQEAGGDAAPAKRLRLSFEDYKRLTNMLVMRLRHAEVAAASAETADGEEAETGMRLQDLVAWYLNEISDQIDSETELVQRKTIVERVIKRLYTHESVLIQLTNWRADADEKTDDDNPILVVHPSYVLQDVE